MLYPPLPPHQQESANRGHDPIDLPVVGERPVGADEWCPFSTRLKCLGLVAIGLAATTLQAQNSTTDRFSPPGVFDFEAPDFRAESVAGQGGWRVDQGVATVHTGQGWEGSAALSVEPAEPFTQCRLTLSRPAVADSGLFFDFFVRLPAAAPSVLDETFDIDSARIGLFCTAADPSLAEWHVFHGNGQGDGVWLNTGVAAALDPLTEGTLSWTRLTIRADVSDRTWKLWVDGVLAAAGLGFQYPAEESLSHFFILGDAQWPVILDNLQVSVENPPDLVELETAPPAPIPEEVGLRGGAAPSEMGSLLDSDADGLPDEWEIAHGLNAHDPADAASDLDADGLTTLDEFLLRSDPSTRDIRRSVASTTAEVFNRFAGASARRVVDPNP